jgi:nucleotide-binding universal stress UspA family protein
MASFPAPILLATDGSADARLATQAAIDLARRTRAALHVVHAWENFYALGGMVPAAYPLLDEEGGRQLLDEEVASIRAAGVTLESALLAQGPPAEVILDAATRTGAQLILLGSRGLGAVRRVVMGSVSEGVTHHATVPVLVMRGSETAWPPRHVVVGDDGSADALRGMRMAAEIAALFGVPVTLLRAMPHLHRELDAGAGPLDDRTVDEAFELAQRELEDHARSLGDGAAASIKVQLSVQDPAAALLHEAARDDGEALVAVGCRGLGVVQRIRFGSVSTKVMRGAHGPVLITPHGEAAAAQPKPHLHLVAGR